MSPRRLRVPSALFAVVCLGCAPRPAVRPQEPPSPPTRAAPPPRPSEERDGLSVSGGLGQVDEAEVDERFRGRLPDINRCYQDALQRQWFLSGRMALRLRIAKDGQVRSAAVMHSSLGCYEVERCVALVAQKLRFPPPKGGEAELTYPVEFPARATVRAWSDDKVASQMARHKSDVGRCQGLAGKAKGPAALRMTVYIGPGGRVASAGLSADDPIDERLGSCLISRVQAWRFEDPLGQLVKASYAFD